MEFDGWTYGEPVNDLWNGQPDSLWLKVKGQNLWVPSAYMIGYPPGYKQPGSSAGNTGNTGGGKPILNFNSGGKSPNGNWTYLSAESGGGAITGTTGTDKKILDIINGIEKQNASINGSNNAITFMQKEIKTLDALIMKKQQRINEIKNENFWWISPANLFEIMQLEITIKQAEDQRNLDRQTITDLDSEKKNAEEQRNVQINELKQLTFIGSVQKNADTQANNNRANIRSKPSSKNENNPIIDYMPIGQELLFSGWIDNDEGRWYRMAGSGERWVFGKNIDLNGNLPESLKIPVSSNNSTSKLGSLSEKYESGGKGPGTVSSGVGDPGGVSYGTYQFTSKTDGKTGGRVLEFLNSSNGSTWKEEFKGLIPGSKDFSDKWKKIALREPDKFGSAQHEFIKRTHYDVLANLVKEQLNFDVNQRSQTLQDVFWSTSVQMGPSTIVVSKALANKNVLKMSDEEIIKAIYSERGSKNSNGDLAYFTKSDKSQQANIAQRFISEEADALAMLKKEIG
jgi:hypothetical protein